MKQPRSKWDIKPGSDEAREKGCTCAVMDNNRGLYPPWPPDGWWITEGCPVHASAGDTVAAER